MLFFYSIELVLIRVLRVGYVSGISTTRLVGISRPWLRRNWGERNFGFDALKSRLNHDMEKGLSPVGALYIIYGLWVIYYIRVIYIGSGLHRRPGAHGARDMEEAAEA